MLFLLENDTSSKQSKSKQKLIKHRIINNTYTSPRKKLISAYEI